MTFFLLDRNVKSRRQPTVESVDFSGKEIKYIKFNPKARKRRIGKELAKHKNALISKEIKVKLKKSGAALSNDMFLRRAIKNTFIEFLKKNKSLSVGIIFDGDYEFLEKVFALSKSVVVFTEEIDSDFPEYLFDKYGHSPIVTSFISASANCNIMFSENSSTKLIPAFNKDRLQIDNDSITDKEGFFSLLPYGFEKLEAAIYLSHESGNTDCHGFYFEKYRLI